MSFLISISWLFYICIFFIPLLFWCPVRVLFFGRLYTMVFSIISSYPVNNVSSFFITQ